MSMAKRTTEDLKFLLVYAAGAGLGVKEEAVAELLRRERAKVAAEVRAFPSCRPACEKVGLCECYSYLSFDLLASRIEGHR